MKEKSKFSVISAAGYAAKRLLFEIASPTKETRNKREFVPVFLRYQCEGKFVYKGIEYPIVLRLLNDSEPQQNGEIRIVDNPLLTNRIFKVRGANSDRIEINPWIDDADKLFNLSCIILAHAVHGKGFFPSPGKEKKNRKYRRRLLDIEG